MNETFNYAIALMSQKLSKWAWSQVKMEAGSGSTYQNVYNFNFQCLVSKKSPSTQLLSSRWFLGNFINQSKLSKIVAKSQNKSSEQPISKVKTPLSFIKLSAKKALEALQEYSDVKESVMVSFLL